MVSAPEKPIEAGSPSQSWAGIEFPLLLRVPEGWELTDDALLELAAINEEWIVEADAAGGLLIMPPPAPQSGEREMDIGSQVFALNLANKVGRAFGEVMFRLPNGSRRAPDACWISDERLSGIEPGDEGVWAVCPDFVVEVRSVTDRLAPVQAKMEMWQSQGARLGWLVDPFEGVVWVYGEESEPERFERPLSLIVSVASEDWEIDLSRIWR